MLIIRRAGRARRSDELLRRDPTRAPVINRLPSEILGRGSPSVKEIPAVGTATSSLAQRVEHTMEAASGPYHEPQAGGTLSTINAGSGDITPDEPYIPSFDRTDDQREVLRLARAGGRQAEHPSLWNPRQGRSGQSLLPPLDQEFDDRLTQAEAKVDRGELLDETDLQYLSRRGAMRLLRSRRPGTVAIAVQVLAKIEETLARTRRQLEEAERERSVSRSAVNEEL